MNKRDKILLEEAYCSIYESSSILIPRRSKEERQRNYKIALQKQIVEYIKNGSKGDLNLGGMPITSLPEGLKVGGGLDLSDTPITSLPKGLRVGDVLYLSYTGITNLPEDLTVGGYLYLDNTPISKKYTKQQLKQMLPNVEYIMF